MPLPNIPQGIETRCDEILADVRTQLLTKQPAYLASKGKLWQGIETHSSPPADGGKTAPDRSRRPTDQAESWADHGVTLPAQTEISVRVDVYQSLSGWGWVLTGRIRIGGSVYVRAINEGAESYRAHPWQLFG